MPKITLPDGTVKSFDNSVSVRDVAGSIGAGLAKAALAGRVDGELVDTSYVISNDAELSIITAKNDEGLDIIRHSSAHLLAQAIKRLYPSAQVTIGPVIEDGFYYDIAFERSFTPDDLNAIEKEMEKCAKEAAPIAREEMARDEAIEFFANMGEHYKAKIIADIPANETLSLYRQGDFIDLCRGPHVPNTSHLKAFKLTKLAGAYWRGNSDNEMLQRIYGTAWADKKQLKAYLHRIEEAEKRDHRKIAKAMDLYHIQEEAPGMIFWHPNGWAIYQAVEQYMRQKVFLNGYHEIKTPQILDKTLWEKSGHADMYMEHMFTTNSEEREFAIKPMSCPCHVEVFKQGLKSYRDLPLRFSEFGSCHRNEFSGTLHGLMRVRNFVQDDGHIFCTEGQVQDEARDFINMLKEVYEDFGFTDLIVRLSLRPDKRVGSDELWDKAEQSLEKAIQAAGLNYQAVENEGAFYGPKIDFSLKDCIGRQWQLGTLQLDYCLPGRLGAEYVGEDGQKHVPVMLHRAIYGSLERFIGVLIEHYAGQFPLWLAPVQAVIMNITDKQQAYCQEMTKKLQKMGFRVNSDLRNEKIGFKIREHTLCNVPLLLVVGDKELENQSVAVRLRNGKNLGTMSIDEFTKYMQRAVANYSRAVEEQNH